MKCCQALLVTASGGVKLGAMIALKQDRESMLASRCSSMMGPGGGSIWAQAHGREAGFAPPLRNSQTGVTV